MTHAELITKFEKEKLSPDEIFALARSVAYFQQRSDSDKQQSLDLVIRLIDRRTEFEEHLPGIARMIDAIAREAGLYPYMQEPDGWRDELAIELMRAPGLDKVVFHIEQARVFQLLAQGRSVILSAPTSFGKSLLIDALIAYRRPKTVVAVVPTIALLDEFRRRLERRFSEYQIITRSQEARTGSLAIYIGTQERLLERDEIDAVDLFIIDEFYKLDLERNDKRSLALNAILARHGKNAKQLYLLGPSIDAVPNANSFRSGIEFVRTRYSPVTADIIDRTAVGPSPSQLVEDLVSVRGTSSLIYVQSPPASARLANELISANIQRKSDFCLELADWLAANFHPEWILVETVRRGFGIHHGRIPRSIAQLLISLFNDGELAAIICTSSMIEGINTAAENVFIYDKNISTSKLDRFTFENIKGRAGRMFKHNIGKIFVYNTAPEPASFDVRIPLFSSDELMSPELLLRIADENLTTVARRRKRAITNASALPTSVLSTWAEFGIDELNELGRQIRSEARRLGDRLIWKGIPTYNQIASTFEVAWEVLDFQKHDIRSAKQLALYASRLRQSRSLRDYFDLFVTQTGIDAQPEIDRCFNFMRGAEYTFPQVLRAMNDVADAVLGEQANYRVFAAQLQNLFLPGELRALDEYGVPLPLVRRLSRQLIADDIEGSRKILSSPNNAILQSLSSFERVLLARSLG